MSDKLTSDDAEARAQEITAAFLEAHWGGIVQALSERLRQTGSEGQMPVCCDLLDGVRTYVRTPFPSGKYPKQIANDLRISVRTIGTYRGRILKKMAMKSNAEIIHYAAHRGLF